MSATEKFTVLVLCALLAAGVLTFLRATREPSVDGRTLSEWLRLETGNSFPSDKRDMTNAVRKIGVKGIPILIDKLRARDSVWKERVREKLRFGVTPDRNAAGYQHAEACLGFSILGTQAVSAIPELSWMLFDTNAAYASGRALGSIGPASLPVLKEALTNPAPEIRYRAANGMNVRPDVARLAMPEILTLRDDADRLAPHIVLSSASSWLPENESWPIFSAYLNASRPDVQSRALHAIRSCVRTNSAGTIPLIVPFLTNVNSNVRENATNTLIALDPVSAGRYGINTNVSRVRGRRGI